jgi:hypothetical protein
VGRGRCGFAAASIASGDIAGELEGVFSGAAGDGGGVKGPEGWEGCGEGLRAAASLTAKWEAPYGEVCIGVWGGGAYNFVRCSVFVVSSVLDGSVTRLALQRA